MNEELKYRAKRESLSIKAERYANEKCGRKCPVGESREEWAAEWNAVFHSKMNKLVKAAGI